MSHQREGLLAQIEAGVLDDKVPVSSLLQKCIVLGGQAGSERMRDWARGELNGYDSADSVPAYRHVRAALMIIITNSAGYNGMIQRIDDSVFPNQIREMFRDQGVSLEDAILPGGIGELEAMANQDKDFHDIIPAWSSIIVGMLNNGNRDPFSRVAEAYWAVSNAAIRGLLVQVRTALAELVAELIVLTPPDQEVPDKLAADQVTQFLITGDRATINYSVKAGRDAMVAGRDATISGTE
jgi:hypothetical protein